MAETLTPDQIDAYRRDGYLVLPGVLPRHTVEALRAEIARFTEIARGMTASDDRIDLEDSHRPDAPRIRRVKLPHRQSNVVNNLLRSDAILGPARDLLGSSVRLQTSKLNMKSAGYGAAVEWHQDWAFYPYTNDDVLAVGVLMDDMGDENGPLMVFPGTHIGPVFNHHHNGIFAGAMDLAASGLSMSDAVPLTGPAGSLTIHHARTVHGSALNLSDRDRRVIFFEMMAADAFPIAGGMGKWEGIEEFDSRLLCGEPTLEPRMTACPVRIAFPEPPKRGSIYEMQKSAGTRAFETIGEDE